MKKIPLILSLILFISFNVNADEVKKGDRAPAFQAKDDQGDVWKLENHLGQDFIVLYFYPAAMTGGCTKQACSYRDFQEEFQDLDATVVGISGDEVNNLKVFKEAHQLNFTLLSDPDGSIAKKYGVPLKEGGSIDREVNGISHTLNRGVTTSRWTFVIDKEGKVLYKNANVNATEDSKEVMEVIRKHKNN